MSIPEPKQMYEMITHFISQIKPYISVVAITFEGVLNEKPENCIVQVYGAGWNTGHNEYTVQEIDKITNGQTWEFHEYWTEVKKDDQKSGEYMILRTTCENPAIIVVANTGTKRIVWRNMNTHKFPFWMQPPKELEKGVLYPTESKRFLLRHRWQIVLNYGFDEEHPKG